MSFLKKLKTDLEERGGEQEGAKKEKEEEEEKKETKVKTSKKKKGAGKDWPKAEGQLTVDVYQTDSSFYIQAPIAGVNTEDLDVEVENEMLVIKGERREPDVNEEKSYFHQECYWGPFSRQIILPEEADTRDIQATFENGILTIRIPRLIQSKKKKINIAVK